MCEPDQRMAGGKDRMIELYLVVMAGSNAHEEVVRGLTPINRLKVRFCQACNL